MLHIPVPVWLHLDLREALAEGRNTIRGRREEHCVERRSIEWGGGAWCGEEEEHGVGGGGA